MGGQFNTLIIEFNTNKGTFIAVLMPDTTKHRLLCFNDQLIKAKPHIMWFDKERRPVSFTIVPTNDLIDLGLVNDLTEDICKNVIDFKYNSEFKYMSYDEFETGYNSAKDSLISKLGSLGIYLTNPMEPEYNRIMNTECGEQSKVIEADEIITNYRKLQSRTGNWLLLANKNNELPVNEIIISGSFENWLFDLKSYAAEQTGTNINDIKINDVAAKEWYNDNTPIELVFRENWKHN